MERFLDFNSAELKKKDKKCARVYRENKVGKGTLNR